MYKYYASSSFFYFSELVGCTHAEARSVLFNDASDTATEWNDEAHCYAETGDEAVLEFRSGILWCRKPFNSYLQLLLLEEKGPCY